MYESHYTHLFFRLWGLMEGKNGEFDENTELLGNSQNKFDAQLGDVVGKVGTRHFIIEFKLERSGIRQELKTKTHRAYLIAHLKRKGKIAQRCRELSTRCHYAAYGDAAKRISFEVYYQAAALAPEPFQANFKTFYNVLNRKSTKQTDEGFFETGIGLPEESFKEYIDCMYSHLEEWEYDDGKVVLGALNPESGELVTFQGTLKDLTSELTQAFIDSNHALQVNAQDMGNSSKKPGPR